MKLSLSLSLIILLLVSAAIPEAAAQNWQWGKTLNTNVFEWGHSCISDRFDNLYFCSGNGIGQRGFVCRYDTAGNLKWINTSLSQPYSIKADNYGNIYAFCAYTTPTIVIGSTVLYHSPENGLQYFIIKLDTSGNVIWAKNAGTGITFSISTLYGKGLDLDTSGNIIITYPFSNNATIGSFLLTNHKLGQIDMLVAKLDSSGNPIWAKSFGGNGHDYPGTMVVTPSNNICIAGTFEQDTISFGTTTLADTNASGIKSTFIVKLDADGNVLWAQKADCTDQIVVYDITADDADNIYTTGYFNGTIKFGTYTFFCPQDYPLLGHGFLAKYSPSGNVAWAKTTQGNRVDRVTTDHCGDIWLTTDTYYPVDTIDGHVFTQLAPYRLAMHLVRWDAAGNYKESTSLADGGFDNLLAFDSKNNAYTTGRYDMNPLYIGPDTLHNDSGMIFFAKYAPSSNCAGLSVKTLSVADVQLYPNPVENEIYISGGIMSLKNSIVSIYDITGQVAGTFRNVNEKITIPVSNLIAGIYYCRISLPDNSVVVKKFCVLK